MPIPIQCLWAPYERHNHSRDCSNYSSNSWVPMRTIVWKHSNAEIIHGMENDSRK